MKFLAANRLFIMKPEIDRQSPAHRQHPKTGEISSAIGEAGPDDIDTTLNQGNLPFFGRSFAAFTPHLLYRAYDEHVVLEVD